MHTPVISNSPGPGTKLLIYRGPSLIARFLYAKWDWEIAHLYGNVSYNEIAYNIRSVLETRALEYKLAPQPSV